MNIIVDKNNGEPIIAPSAKTRVSMVINEKINYKILQKLHWWHVSHHHISSNLIIHFWHTSNL